MPCRVYCPSKTCILGKEELFDVGYNNHSHNWWDSDVLHEGEEFFRPHKLLFVMQLKLAPEYS